MTEGLVMYRLNERRGHSIQLGDEPNSSYKYHSSEHSTNPLERISFVLGERMVESPRIRFFISCYAIFVHCIILVLMLRQAISC